MQQLTTIELNNSYCLIITYFLRKFYLLFKLIPPQRTVYFLLLDRSRVREYKFFQYSFQNSKLFLPLKKGFSLRRPFSWNIFQIFSSISSNLLSKKLEISCPDDVFFMPVLVIFPDLEMGRENFETVPRPSS